MLFYQKFFYFVVFDAVLSHILDSETSSDAALFETDFITLHQFMDFFTDKKIQSVLSYVLEVAKQWFDFYYHWKICCLWISIYCYWFGV